MIRADRVCQNQVIWSVGKKGGAVSEVRISGINQGADGR